MNESSEASWVSWLNASSSVLPFSHSVSPFNFLVCFCQLIYDGLWSFINCFHEVFGSKVAHYILPCHSTWLIGQRGRQWLIQASLTTVARTMPFVEIYRVNSIFKVEADADNSESWSATKSIKCMEIRSSFMSNCGTDPKKSLNWSFQCTIYTFKPGLFGGFFFVCLCFYNVFNLAFKSNLPPPGHPHLVFRKS